jgi:hypothetical protein
MRTAEQRERMRAGVEKWRDKPPGMPPTLVRKFEKAIKLGSTISDLTKPTLSSYLVPHSRFRAHCDLHSAWGRRIYEFSEANASKKKATHSKRAVATRKMCLKGLHPMKGHNLMVDTNKGRQRRRCRACFMARIQGRPMTAETKARIEAALEGGASLAEILWGWPTCGGPQDRSLVITTNGKFYYQRKIDPAFDNFVQKHIADSNSVAQVLRHARDAPAELKPTIIAIARLKHRIKAVGAT